MKYLSVLLNNNLNDNDDIMKQMRGLYARANSLLRKFPACSFEVTLRLFQAFCTSFYCAHLWYKFTKQVMTKARVSYNNVSWLLFGYRKRCSASEMCVTNNIYNFEGRKRNILMILLCRWTASRSEIIALFMLVLSDRHELGVYILFRISVVIVCLYSTLFYVLCFMYFGFVFNGPLGLK